METFKTNSELKKIYLEVYPYFDAIVTRKENMFEGEASKKDKKKPGRKGTEGCLIH